MKADIKVLKTSRAGKFKLSLLELTRVYQQPEFIRDYAPEKVRVQHRVAVQHGRKVNGEWVNQVIWCSPNEFIDLANCIDEFNDLIEDGDVESPSSSSDRKGDEKIKSARIYKIVEFIRSNDLFDLDVMDLREMTPFDVLGHYGIKEKLTEWEQSLLMKEMEKLSHALQTVEISRSVSQA